MPTEISAKTHLLDKGGLTNALQGVTQGLINTAVLSVVDRAEHLRARGCCSVSCTAGCLSGLV